MRTRESRRWRLRALGDVLGVELPGAEYRVSQLSTDNVISFLLYHGRAQGRPQCAVRYERWSTTKEDGLLDSYTVELYIVPGS